jgi:hypothetical protein
MLKEYGPQLKTGMLAIFKDGHITKDYLISWAHLRNTRKIEDLKEKLNKLIKETYVKKDRK